MKGTSIQQDTSEHYRYMEVYYLDDDLSLHHMLLAYDSHIQQYSNSSSQFC